MAGVKIKVDCKKCKKKFSAETQPDLMSKEFLEHHAHHINYRCNNCGKNLNKDFITNYEVFEL